MRLLYVTSQFPWSNGEAFFLPEVQELVRQGTELSIVPIHPEPTLPPDRAHLLANSPRAPLLSARILQSAARAPWPRSRRALERFLHLSRQGTFLTKVKNTVVLPKALWLAETASRFRADHIHALWASTCATVAMVASEISGIPWSFSAHRGDLEEPNLLAEKMESAGFVRFISEDGRRWAKRIVSDTNVAKMLVRHLGVSVPDRNLYDPGTSASIGLCPAALIPRKGQDYLLGAVRRLLLNGCKTEIWFAGQGAQESLLKERAKDLVAAGAARFLGSLPHDALLGLYKKRKVGYVVLPSLHEGIPVSLMEAMAHGVPVIGTDVGGTRELLGDGAGILIPPKDEEATAEAIRRLARNERGRLELSQRGYQRVRADFNVVRTATELEALCAQHAVQRIPPASFRMRQRAACAQ